MTGVGIQKAGKVYYNAMLAKTSTWRYANVRVASLNAAKNLFPGLLHRVQHRQGRLERDLGAGAGGRGDLLHVDQRLLDLCLAGLRLHRAGWLGERDRLDRADVRVRTDGDAFGERPAQRRHRLA